MSRRKEFRYTKLILEDGFSGTVTIADASIAANDTTLLVNSATHSLHDSATIVPVGARFTTPSIATIRSVTAENHSMVWTLTVDATSGNFTLTFQGQTTANIAENAAASAVQSALEALSNVAPGDLLVTGSAGGPYTITAAATYANTSGLVLTATDVDLAGGGDTITVTVVENGLKTWQLTFTPALVAGSLPSNSQTITFLPIQLVVDVGEANFEADINFDPIFDTNRNILDGVRLGKDVPMDVRTGTTFNWMKSSSGKPLTPYEILTREGNASGWHSTAADPCEPYCVDIILLDEPVCGSEQKEQIRFPRFYPTKITPNINDGQIALVGKCNAVKPVITRI